MVQYSKLSEVMKAKDHFKNEASLKSLMSRLNIFVIAALMHATAEIITEDLRLLERLFMPLKKVFSEQ